MSREQIGLFGGTFDPPHLGHLILASEACEQLQLTRLLWVLAPEPPHKREQSITSTQHRLAMVKLATAGDARFEVSSIELERPGPHYTLDTVNLIADLYPSADIILLIGGDSLHDLPTWHRPADLVTACHAIGVMHRPGDSADLSELESQLNGISSKIRFVDAPLLEIASREIRHRVAEDRSVRYYLHPEVYEYIQKNGLYRRK
jgi:nicotinate-nucleotide adenylyltransferase